MKKAVSALKPKVRERSIQAPEEYVDAACQLKRENMSRSIDTIIFMLESQEGTKGVLKEVPFIPATSHFCNWYL